MCGCARTIDPSHHTFSASCTCYDASRQTGRCNTATAGRICRRPRAGRLQHLGKAPLGSWCASSGAGMRIGLLVGLLAASIRRVEAYPGDSDPWWVFVTMPFISGAVGYVTNILALKMTFYPVEFWGIKIWQPEDQPLGCIGWQGIVPAKAAKMAQKSVTLMTEKLINIKEVFSRLDPDEMCEALEPGLLAVVSRVVTEMAAKHMPGTWHFLPEASRDDIVLKALEDVPIFMRSFMGEVKTNIDDVLDVHHMVITNLVKNKALMNRVFMEVGAKELVFIERSGLLFGFLFGCLQTCLWYFYQENWVLPVGGLVVGWLTNYLALKMIFRPVNERIVCGLKLQGLFLKRQTEVSAHFAEITSNEILTSQAMWEAILTGPKRDSFNDMCKRHTHNFVDDMAGSMRPLVQHMIGENEFVGLKDEIAQQMIENLPMAIRFGHTYTTKALDMSNTIRVAMQGLSPAEFEGVLHPVFEEDEWKLILVGAALGAAVGVFQLFVLF
ncbi:conserved unknown protein [Ectocarpus siliculosus]|uniref:DUF445 domain-containing protein n=1 Tax=Ectocarpus siliculosus TaxID=2880 RepID=D7G378_ECTSI|nr:conserved unknown protein [Ectocarpus siliculosus]|eukprot:CBJ26925.1 conserved unknown protein [Ectocarpus siliculosus]